MNKKYWTILATCITIFLVYLKFSLNDEYFSYFDVYNYQWHFERWLKIREMRPDRVIGFYFFENNILQMTGMTRYSLTRWGNIPILFFQLGLIYLIYIKNYNKKWLIFFLILFISFNPVFYWRNTLNLRENIYAWLLLVLVYFSTIKWNGAKIILIILYICILHWHPLISFLALPIMVANFYKFIYPGEKLVINIIKYSVFALCGIFLSIFSFKWILIQLSWYPIPSEGSWLNFSWGLSKNIDNLYFTLLTMFFWYGIVSIKKLKKPHIFLIWYIIFFFELSFLPLGVAQYRFYPYLLIFLTLFMGFYFLNKTSKIIQIILLFCLIVIWVPKLILVTWYYAVNAKNMELLKHYLTQNPQVLQNTVHCWRASCSAIRFIYPKKNDILQLDTHITEDDANNSPYPLILFRDDENYYKWRQLDNVIILK